MKTNTRLQVILIAAGFSAAIALSAGTASAEDFNPQPDPPGKAQALVKGAHNPPAFKTGAANKATGIPPSFKGGAVDKATGIPPGFKTDKTIKLDTSKVGVVEATK